MNPLIRLGVGLLFWLPCSARGMDLVPSCLIQFATLEANEAQAPDLVSRTYAELFDKTGGLKLGAETIQRLVNGGDPFAIPEQVGTDTGVLKKRMVDFEAMVKSRGWDSPELRHRLLTEMMARLTLEEQAAVKVETALQKSEAPHVVTWPQHGVTVMSPDGKYFLTTSDTPLHKRFGPVYGSPVYLYNLETRVKTETGSAIGAFFSGVFSPKGDEVTFGDVGAVIQRVPFKDGVLDWSHARQIGTRDTASSEDNRVLNLHYSSNPDRVYGGRNGNNQKLLWLFDAKKNQRIKIDVDGYDGGGEVKSWGVLPGTDELYLLRTQGKATRLHYVTVNDLGVITKVNADTKWEQTPGPPTSSEPHTIEVAPDGKRLLAHGGTHAYVLRPGNSTPQELNVGVRNGEMITTVALHPTKEEAVVLVRDWTSNATKLNRVNLGTGTVAGSLDMSREQPYILHLSPDGEWIWTSTNEAKTIKTYRYDRHFPN